MGRPRVIRQIYVSVLLIALGGLGAGTWYSARVLRQAYLDEMTADLKLRAELAGRLVIERLNARGDADFEAWCRELGVKASSRITVIAPSGKVLGDSMEDPEKMDNHSDRPEVKDALRTGFGSSMRFSHTIKKNLLYVAIPLRKNGATTAIVRVAVPITFIDEALGAIRARILAGVLVIALLSAGITYWFARRISKPLEEMKETADRYVEGDLSARMTVTRSEEIGGLAERINQMAARLDDRIRAVVRQTNEQETVLASMAEGVLAVDGEGRILKLNASSAELLETDPALALGKHLQEVVRNSELERLVDQTLKTARPAEGEIVLGPLGREKFMQVHCTTLKDEGARATGVVVVLNDVSHLRKLERVRRDFVANVSHELKTPITSIKGFVETLQDGALNDPEETKKFLAILARQSDRLNAIIEDLLSLSRIEQEAEKGEIALEETGLKGVLASAIQSCERQAREKNVLLELSAEDDLVAGVNAPLLEQAVVNLIDNAVKYSEIGGKVKVEAARAESEIQIRVRDSGCGISAEHLPRIFERFYRVDKARSRKLGGTGLGLAIVKHIAQAHGGSASVQSVKGEGSVFTIHLPVV